MDECRKTALVLGVTGQDGNYLSKLLLAKGYRVVGTYQHTPGAVDTDIDLLPLSLDSDIEIYSAIDAVQPHELYNLAGPSRPGGSFKDPGYYMRCCGVAVQTILQAVKECAPHCRVFQAGSSEQYGIVTTSAQTEESPMCPHTPYGLAKVVAHEAVKQYRRWGGYAVNGILFNHESPLRPDDFVSQKIVRAVMRMARGEGRGVRLGNKHAQRDWSHAEDIVRGMWLSLQHPTPADYVFASGVVRSVEYMVKRAAQLAGLPRAPWITVDRKLFREEVSLPLLGVYSRAADRLGWEPLHSFDALLIDMLRHA